MEDMGRGGDGDAVKDNGFILVEKIGDGAVNDGRAGGKDEIAPGAGVAGIFGRFYKGAGNHPADIVRIEINHSDLIVGRQNLGKSGLTTNQQDFTAGVNGIKQIFGTLFWFVIFAVNGFRAKVKMPKNRIKAGYKAGPAAVIIKLDFQKFFHPVICIFKLIGKGVTFRLFKDGFDHDLFAFDDGIIIALG